MENSSGNIGIIFRAWALFFVGNGCLNTKEFGKWVKNSETSELVTINEAINEIFSYLFQDEQPQSRRWNSGTENKSRRGNEFEDEKLTIEKNSFGFNLFSLRQNVLWMMDKEAILPKFRTHEGHAII